MMDFSNVKSIVIPEGEVSIIAKGSEILWRKQRYKTELEYIESTGTQYIDTRFKPDENSKMVLDFYPTAKQSTCYAGCRNNDTYAKFTINSGKAGTLQYGGLGESGNVSLGAFSIGRHTVSIENGVFTYDGKEVPVSSSKIETLNAKYTVFLFACNISGPTLQATCRIYSCKLWDNGVPVRDFIPVLDWNDRPCMYDKITNQLFYNAGTGEFDYQRYKTELAYIETTGSQYIKTGITTTGNTRVVAQMMALEKGTTGRYVYLFSSKTNLFSARMHWSNGMPYNTYGSTDSIIFYESEVGDMLNINFGSGTATINTYSKNIPYVEFTDGELQIFARNGGYRSKARLWTFQVYDGETLVRDFIPVLDMNDIPCLYDKISTEFFYSQGTDNFIYE